MDTIAPFELDDRALLDVRDEFATRVREGLARENQEILGLPAWLAPPDGGTLGRAVVVDTGGTNMRAALVELLPGTRSRILKGPVEATVPREPRIDRDEFFRVQATLVAELSPPPDVPVGYCFSYPTTLEPDGDAILLRWTKGIQIEGVEGTHVGNALREAMLNLGLAPGPVRVLNDTVAALAAGAWHHQCDDYPETIGLIVGTGTNMASFLPRVSISKLGASNAEAASTDRMAVNLESGNFHPPHLTPWDDELDARSDTPGRQRFEKAVSGFYLPYLHKTVLPTSTAVVPEQGSRILGELRSRNLPGDDARLARALLDRSADLVAAAIVGLCDPLPLGAAVAVVAEGSLFWKSEGYEERTRSTLSRLFRGERSARVVGIEDANFTGSACAALSS